MKFPKIFTILTLIAFLSVALVPLPAYEGGGFGAIFGMVLGAIVTWWCGGCGGWAMLALNVAVQAALMVVQMVTNTMGLGLAMLGGCAGEYDSTFGTCTKVEPGTVTIYTNLPVSIDKITIGATPTPEEFVENPTDGMVEVTIEWTSAGQPGTNISLRLYDADAKVPTYAGQLIFPPQPEPITEWGCVGYDSKGQCTTYGYITSYPPEYYNACSSGDRIYKYLVPEGRYQAEIWGASCWQMCGSLGCPKPACTGCGGDRLLANTNFEVPAFPSPFADLKANGEDSLLEDDYSAGDDIELSWTSKYATVCTSFGDWTAPLERMVVSTTTYQPPPPPPECTQTDTKTGECIAWQSYPNPPLEYSTTTTFFMELSGTSMIKAGTGPQRYGIECNRFGHATTSDFVTIGDTLGPIIESFSASSTKLSPGDKTQIEWTAGNASFCKFNIHSVDLRSTE